MRIRYLIGDIAPGLSGGMLSVALTVDALRQLGHEADVVSTFSPPDWLPVETPWKVAERPGRELREADAVVAGFRGTRIALDAGVPVVAHLCAGFERYLWPSLSDQIEAAYRRPTVKMVVSPHLKAVLSEEVGVESVFVGTALRTSWFRTDAVRDRGARSVRVLTVGADPDGHFAPVPFKGIENLLEICRRARQAGAEFQLVRMAPREDPWIGDRQVDEVHLGVEPRSAPEVYRSCDVFLSASTFAEGLGKPAVEAALSGLPGVLPTIPSYTGIPELERATLFYESGNLDEGAASLVRLVEDEDLRLDLGERAREIDVEHQFDPLNVAGRVATALERPG